MHSEIRGRMRIKEFITIDRSRNIVWEHVHDPRFMVKWNPRIHKLIPNEESLPGINYKFRVLYEILGSAENFEGQIFEYRSNSHLSIRYLSSDKKYKGYILEGLELSDTKSGTKLCHWFDFKHSGLNIITRTGIFILGFLGRPIGKRYLSSLKSSIEN